MINPRKVYKILEIPELHSFFHRFRGTGRTNIYTFVRNYIPYTFYATPTGKKKYFVRGNEIIKFLKNAGLDIDED